MSLNLIFHLIIYSAQSNDYLKNKHGLVDISLGPHPDGDKTDQKSANEKYLKQLPSTQESKPTIHESMPNPSDIVQRISRKRKWNKHVGMTLKIKIIYLSLWW